MECPPSCNYYTSYRAKREYLVCLFSASLQLHFSPAAGASLPLNLKEMVNSLCCHIKP